MSDEKAEYDYEDEEPPSGIEICARVVEKVMSWWWVYLIGLIVIVTGWIIYFQFR